MSVWFAIKLSDGQERVWFTTDSSVYVMSSESLKDDARWRFGEGQWLYDRDAYVFGGYEVDGRQLVNAKLNAWNDLDTSKTNSVPAFPQKTGVTLEELFAEDDEG